MDFPSRPGGGYFLTAHPIPRGGLLANCTPYTTAVVIRARVRKVFVFDSKRKNNDRAIEAVEAVSEARAC